MEKQEEIDIARVLQLMWNRRGFILRVTVIALLIGLAAALLGRVRYTATAVIVPQIGKSASGGNLQGLAAMAGINLGMAEQGDLLSPMVYPMVIASIPFQKDLIHSPVITAPDGGGRTTLLDFYTGGGFGRSVWNLPQRILAAIRGGRTPVPVPDSLAQGIATLTYSEYECMRFTVRHISITVNEKNGYITLSATMPGALMSAEVASRVQELLQDYITRYKVQKARADLDFIEERYREVRAEFEEKQHALARFQDANRDISSALARIRENTLTNEYDLAFSIYSEIASQREQAGIKVKEDTPIFTVIEPVSVPVEKSAPRRMLIMAVSLLLGLCIGGGLVFVFPSGSPIFNAGRWPLRGSLQPRRRR